MSLLAQGDSLTAIGGTFKELGLLAGLLVLLLFACWSIARSVASWIKPHLDKIIEAHVTFLDKTSGAVDKLQETAVRQQELTEHNSRRLDDIEEIARSQVQGGEMVKHWSGVLGAIHDDVKDTKSAVGRIEGKLKP